MASILRNDQYKSYFKEEFSLIGLWTSTRSVYDDIRNYYIYKHDYYGEGEHLYIKKGTGYYIYEGPSGEGIRWFGRLPFKPGYQDANGYWHEKNHGFIWDADASIPFWNYGKISDFEQSDGVRYIDPDRDGVFSKKPDPLSFDQFLTLYDSDTVITNKDSSEVFLKLNDREFSAHLAHAEYLKEYDRHDSLMKPEAVLHLVDRYSHAFPVKPKALDYDAFLDLFDQNQSMDSKNSLSLNLEAEIKVDGYKIPAILAHKYYLKEFKKHPSLSETEAVHKFVGMLAKFYEDSEKPEIVTLDHSESDHAYHHYDVHTGKHPVKEEDPLFVSLDKKTPHLDSKTIYTLDPSKVHPNSIHSMDQNDDKPQQETKNEEITPSPSLENVMNGVWDKIKNKVFNKSNVEGNSKFYKIIDEPSEDFLKEWYEFSKRTMLETDKDGFQPFDAFKENKMQNWEMFKEAEPEYNPYLQELKEYEFEQEFDHWFRKNNKDLSLENYDEYRMLRENFRSLKNNIEKLNEYGKQKIESVDPDFDSYFENFKKEISNYKYYKSFSKQEVKEIYEEIKGLDEQELSENSYNQLRTYNKAADRVRNEYNKLIDYDRSDDLDTVFDDRDTLDPNLEIESEEFGSELGIEDKEFDRTFDRFFKRINNGFDKNDPAEQSFYEVSKEKFKTLKTRVQRLDELGEEKVNLRFSGKKDFYNQFKAKLGKDITNSENLENLDEIYDGIIQNIGKKEINLKKTELNINYNELDSYTKMSQKFNKSYAEFQKIGKLDDFDPLEKFYYEKILEEDKSSFLKNQNPEDILKGLKQDFENMLEENSEKYKKLLTEFNKAMDEETLNGSSSSNSIDEDVSVKTDIETKLENELTKLDQEGSDHIASSVSSDEGISADFDKKLENDLNSLDENMEGEHSGINPSILEETDGELPIAETGIEDIEEGLTPVETIEEIAVIAIGA